MATKNWDGTQVLMFSLDQCIIKKDSDNKFKFIAKILDKHLNAQGIAHGGFSMALADIFFGSVAFSACGKKSTSTISLNSNFVSPGLLDEIVECEATITKMTRSLIFVEGSIKSGEKNNIISFWNLENTWSVSQSI